MFAYFPMSEPWKLQAINYKLQAIYWKIDVGNRRTGIQETIESEPHSKKTFEIYYPQSKFRGLP